MTATRFGGEVALIGGLARDESDETRVPMVGRGLRASRIDVGSRAMFEDMNRALALREVHPVVDRVFELGDAVAAYRHLEELKHELDSTQVYHHAEVEAFAQVFYKPPAKRNRDADQARMEAQLQPARDRFTALDEEDQTAFRDRGGGSGRSLLDQPAPERQLHERPGHAG